MNGPAALPAAVEHHRAGRFDEAERLYRSVLAGDPENADALHLLGVLRTQRGEPAQGIELIRRALALRPSMPMFHNNLGKALADQMDWPAAIAAYRRAVELEPRYAEARYNLGEALGATGDVAGAELAYRQALALPGDHYKAMTKLAALLGETGRPEGAVEALEALLAEYRQDVTGHRALMLATMYHPGLDAAERFAFHQRFEADCVAPLQLNIAPFDNPVDAERRLRIGWLSSDFRDHSVARNLEPIFASLDRSRFEMICYADAEKPDAMTDRFRRCADGWRDISGIGDAAAAGLIREDRIDILMVLAGRFDRNRPLIAAYKPAPIQVSLFDAATSGLTAMDYFISDRFMVPARHSERFVERVIRLPNFYVHSPLADAPDVQSRPSLRGTAVTFGSFNNPAKVTKRVIELWGTVLNAVPASRLFLRYKSRFEPLRPRIEGVLAAKSIDPERLRVGSGNRQQPQHLALYGEVDIALDPFPFTGSTTTFEALWMGVPVVTLAGDNFMGRWTAAMLRHVGLPELIASSPEEYVAIAARLAGDPARLSTLSAGLRERLAGSVLCDSRRTTRYFGRALRAVWRRYCRATQVA